MEPGWTLLVLLASGDMLVPTPWSALVALDADGEVVWYHEVEGWVGDYAWLGDRVVYSVSNLRMEEIDLQGHVRARWHATGQGTAGAHPEAVLIDVDTLHHELVALEPDDDAAFLALDTERRRFEDYPGDEVTLEASPGATDVVGDVVVEFARDGSVIRRWSLLDVLDPWRLGYDGLIDFWAPVYGPGTRDWSHANAVTLSPERDAYLVSLRHQDAIVKLDRATGELLWIFGDPAGWGDPWRQKVLDVAWRDAPEAGEYPYHPHAPTLTASGDVLLFDNGVQRAVPPAEPLPEVERYSRAVQYAIDEEVGRVEQSWAFSGPQGGMYARIVGDADELPTTGHVLVTSGAQEDAEQRTSWARIFEVTRDEPAEIPFDVQIGAQDAEPGTQWVVYRAERIPTPEWLRSGVGEAE
jgi:outer membrane protein assembly factor BamB